MTELEKKAKDCIENHTHKLVDKPTKQDIYLREESIFISGYKLGTTENGIQWHDLRKNPLDLPTRKTTSNGEWYYPLVLCFEYRKDDHGKKAQVYGLDTYNPYPFNEWTENKHGWDAWRELPAPPKENA